MHSIVETLDRAGSCTVWAHLITRVEAEAVVRLALSAHCQHVAAELVMVPIPDFEGDAPAWRFTITD